MNNIDKKLDDLLRQLVSDYLKMADKKFPGLSENGDFPKIKEAKESLKLLMSEFNDVVIGEYNDYQDLGRLKNICIACMEEDYCFHAIQDELKDEQRQRANDLLNRSSNADNL